MKQGITLLIVFLIAITATAYDFEHEGLQFTLLSNNELSVSGLGDSQGEYFSGGILTIPDVVTYGREYAVTKIENQAFSGNKQIATAFIGDAVTEIGSSAFADCTGLLEVTMGKSVKSVQGGAFQNCTLLDKVNITDLTAWCEIDFCPTYKEIEILHPGPYDYMYDIYDSTANPLWDGANLVINGEVVTSLNIPSTVKKIGRYAFYQYKSLTSLTIPPSVTSIGEGAFRGCSGLKSLEIPESVTTIGNAAFSYCRGLKSLEIPDNVTSIGEWAFGYTQIESLRLGNGLTKVNRMAFYGCSSLKSIEWTTSITAIGAFAFSECKSLEAIEILNSVTSIGDMAFYRCGLTSIIIPESVTYVGSNAFFGNKLEKVDIGPSVTTMGQGSFECKTITSFTCRCTTPPTIVTNVSYYWNITSNEVYQNVPLYIPDSSAELYRNTFPWSKFVDIRGYPATKGDINGDSSTDGGDVSIALEMVLAGGVTAEQTAVADLNGDGAVDGGDVSILLEIVLTGQ